MMQEPEEGILELPLTDEQVREMSRLNDLMLYTNQKVGEARRDLDHALMAMAGVHMTFRETRDSLLRSHVDESMMEVLAAPEAQTQVTLEPQDKILRFTYKLVFVPA